ncbi:hypothetical protein [Streptomyces sp. NPDC049813]|uniref:hypothetical protein n=1 Tax=Streptomyces sp. NPDC049813 TaxID=3365597 RepID=UPI0037A079F6
MSGRLPDLSLWAQTVTDAVGGDSTGLYAVAHTVVRGAGTAWHVLVLRGEAADVVAEFTVAGQWSALAVDRELQRRGYGAWAFALRRPWSVLQDGVRASGIFCEPRAGDEA